MRKSNSIAAGVLAAVALGVGVTQSSGAGRSPTDMQCVIILDELKFDRISKVSLPFTSDCKGVPGPIQHFEVSIFQRDPEGTQSSRYPIAQKHIKKAALLGKWKGKFTVPGCTPIRAKRKPANTFEANVTSWLTWAGQTGNVYRYWIDAQKLKASCPEKKFS